MMHYDRFDINDYEKEVQVPVINLDRNRRDVFNAVRNAVIIAVINSVINDVFTR